MQDFIQQAAQQLGASESSIQSATGGVLSLLKDKSDDSDFASLAGKIPGLAELATSGQTAAEGTGGGGLMGMVSSSLSGLGGNLGGAASLVSLIGKSGLSTDQAGGFATMLVGFLQQNAGGDLVGKILSKVPELKKLAG